MVIGNHTIPTTMLRTCSDGLMYCFSSWANDVAQGWFWTLALLAFCVILMISTSRFGTNRSLGYGSFVGMIGSVWLSVMNLMSWWVASIFILAGLAGLAIMIMSEK